MKRLRRATHLVLAWTVICLTFIDPAAACRLLRHRRCCGDSCVPDSCSLDTCSGEDATAPTASAPRSEAAPVEIPPMATTGGGDAPSAPSAVEAPPIQATRPAIVESNLSPAITTPKAEVTTPLLPVIPAKPRQPTT